MSRLRGASAACTTIGFAFALGALSLADPVGAEPSDRVEWNPSWPRFRKAEIAFTAGNGLQALMAFFVYPVPRDRWGGGILFDDAVRDALRLRSREGRDRAAAASDAIYYVMVAYPFAVDNAIVTWGVHGSNDVAVQMLAMNLEAYALTGAFALSAEKIGRSRPSSPECDGRPDYGDKCGDDGELNASLLSGHTSIAFASAGLTCAHHQHLPLYGSGAADLAACVLALGAAATSGVLRVVSDNHYATDIVLATGVGLASGYVMPSLLHYGFSSERSRKPASLLPTFRGGSAANEWIAVLAPEIGADHVGMTLAGTF